VDEWIFDPIGTDQETATSTSLLFFHSSRNFRPCHHLDVYTDNTSVKYEVRWNETMMDRAKTGHHRRS
jgi:hypothetical protein